jgi:hypothetical protein
VDWVKAQGLHPSSIGVLGASLGATFSVHAAAEDSEISTLVVDGAGVNDYATIQGGWTRTTSLPQWFFPAGLLMERFCTATMCGRCGQ